MKQKQKHELIQSHNMHLMLHLNSQSPSRISAPDTT